MKILFILEYFPPYHGGVEKLFDQLTAEISNSSLEVTVLTASYNDLPLEEFTGSVKVVRVKARNRYQFTFSAITTAVRLSKKCDIIHSSTYNAVLPAWIAAKLSSKPIILTVHEYWNKIWWQLPFLNVLQRFTFWSYEQIVLSLPFDKVIGVSNFTTKRLEKRFAKRSISTIYNGQIRIASSVDKHEGNYYLFVGRLGVSKGVDILIQSIVMCFNSGHDFNFKLVIPDSKNHIYQFVLKNLQPFINSQQVELLHNVNDSTLNQLMNNAKAIIIPSYSEGFGFVAAEATSTGTPIIHSGRGALNEVAGGNVITFQDYSSLGLYNAILEAEENKFQYIAPIEFPIEDTAEKYMLEYNRIIHSD